MMYYSKIHTGEDESFGSLTIDSETEPCLSPETSCSQHPPCITLLPSVSIPKLADVTTIAAYDRTVTQVSWKGTSDMMRPRAYFCGLAYICPMS